MRERLSDTQGRDLARLRFRLWQAEQARKRQDAELSAIVDRSLEDLRVRIGVIFASSRITSAGEAARPGRTTDRPDPGE